MALIKFLVNSGGQTIDLTGSGLGFYGAGGFGRSVAVGQFQDNTYVTDSNGIQEGIQASNIKYIHANSGQIPTDVNLNLLNIPNAQASLVIEFTHGDPVEIHNAELRIYNRSDINQAPVGVVTMAAELLHPDVSQENLGSGDASWYAPSGSSVVVPLAQSPGISGLAAGDGTTSTTPDTQHDWYIALSASPSSVGSKTEYGLYVSLEYL